MLYTGHISGTLSTSVLVKLWFNKVVTGCDLIKSFCDLIKSFSPVSTSYRDPRDLFL